MQICNMLEFFLAVLMAMIWWKQAHSDFPGVSVMAGLPVSLLLYFCFWIVLSYVSTSGRRLRQLLVMRHTWKVVWWWWLAVRWGKWIAIESLTSWAFTGWEDSWIWEINWFDLPICKCRNLEVKWFAGHCGICEFVPVLMSLAHVICLSSRQEHVWP